MCGDREGTGREIPQGPVQEGGESHLPAPRLWGRGGGTHPKGEGRIAGEAGLAQLPLAIPMPCPFPAAGLPRLWRGALHSPPSTHLCPL